MTPTYCVIMAGGIGSRFWPLSKTSRPKQFIDILGTGETFIQQTYRRFRKVCDPQNYLIVTNAIYKDLVLEQLPELNEDQVLCEPLRRNTAPCIAYACHRIKSQHENANIIVAPSDHLITNETEFITQIQRGIDFTSKNDVLLTLGIKPSRPETGYGYIQKAESVDFNNADNLFKVKTFTEKPKLKMAKFFLDSGEFFWNSGIFIWSLKSIMKAFEELLPEVNSLFEKGANHYKTPEEAQFINKTYSECKNVSIDYGVMEKAENVHVLTADFGWSDLGTWTSLWDTLDRDEDENATTSEKIMFYESKNCVVSVPNDKLVVVQGLDNYIVAESDNAFLICKKESEQEIRQIVNDVQLAHGDKFM